MSYGTVVVLASGAHGQKLVPSGMQFPSLAILNPNDGVVYMATDRDVSDLGPGSWDWKIPSQSYAVLPGMPYWHSVGLYYLDQSGAGRQGEITFFPYAQSISLPVFQSIGRALQAQSTALDVTTGAQPANPPVGIDRLWIDVNDDLHLLNSGGVDTQWVDFETVLGGDLTGTPPNPTVAARAITNAKIALGTILGVNIAPATITPDKLTASMYAPGVSFTGTVPAAGTTYYGANSAISTDSNASILCCPVYGQLKYLYVRAASAPGVGQSFTINVLVNGIVRLQAILSGAVTVGSDLTNTWTVSAGDLLSIQVIASAGATAPFDLAASVGFQGTTSS